MYSNIVVLLLSSTLAIKSSRAADEDVGLLSRKERDACRYSHFTPSHSMCVVNLIAPEIPMSQADKDAIVSNHNRIRNEVNPPAAGMQKMVWDDELALVALTYAKQCPAKHDELMERAMFSLPGVLVGQSFYYDPAPFHPVAGILVWESEKANYTYKGNNALSIVGHYTEMILEKNAKVGCGMADCTASSLGKNIMVCNYGQIQYTTEVIKPYCPKSDTNCQTCGTTDATYTNLCDCGGKICFNGGAVDPSTCQCTCPTNMGNTILSGSLCETVNCAKYEDNSECDRDYCKSFGFPWSIEFCPSVCHICPKTCALTCQNGGYLNYIIDETETRCACYCPPGFSGANCSSACTLNCNGHGTPNADCSDCTCDPNWGGTNCDNCTLPCGTNKVHDATCTTCVCNLDCNNHGNATSDCLTCTCDPNWGGPTCGVCNLDCNNHGSANSDCLTCTCDQNWGGPTCGVCNMDCNNHGSANSDCLTCTCDPNWGGHTCGVCNLDCNNHGNATSDCLMCTCDPYWGGTTCGDCTLGCNGHGTHKPDCLTCTCDPNWGGDKCDTCTLVCQHRGVLDSAKCECSCRRRFYGTTCDKSCYREARHAIRSRIDYVCRASSTFAYWCPRTCKRCTRWFCRNRRRGLCRYFVRRHIIRGLITFCSAFTHNECSRLCRRFG